MTMTKTQVVALLKENQNERGVANWKKLGNKTGQLKSFGIGLTQLRKLAKQVGRDHKLAQQLWKSNVYDVLSASDPLPTLVDLLRTGFGEAHRLEVAPGVMAEKDDK